VPAYLPYESTCCVLFALSTPVPPPQAVSSSQSFSLHYLCVVDIAIRGRFQRLIATDSMDAPVHLERMSEVFHKIKLMKRTFLKADWDINQQRKSPPNGVQNQGLYCDYCLFYRKLAN
jgi:hypothetical protein